MNIPPSYPLVEVGITIGTYDTVDYAYPDTGFDGGLIIPIGIGQEVISAGYRKQFRLANGQIYHALAWNGFVTIGEAQFKTEIAALGGQYLLGRQILDQLEICFIRGRELRITL
jgi:predicted aspartyl protease